MYGYTPMSYGDSTGACAACPVNFSTYAPPYAPAYAAAYDGPMGAPMATAVSGLAPFGYADGPLFFGQAAEPTPAKPDWKTQITDKLNEKNFGLQNKWWLTIAAGTAFVLYGASTGMFTG